LQREREREKLVRGMGERMFLCHRMKNNVSK
jgi:hypothetical protein